MFQLKIKIAIKKQPYYMLLTRDHLKCWDVKDRNKRTKGHTMATLTPGGLHRHRTQSEKTLKKHEGQLPAQDLEARCP